MGLNYTNFFANLAYEASDTRIITCKGCSSHLCLSEFVISDKFTGGSGPAYLVETVINTKLNPLLQETEMHTGTYLINKVMCHQCGHKLGWYYRKAYSYEQHYKEGKYVIENKFVRFISNNLSTQVLERRALYNKLKRRYSSSSACSGISNGVNVDTEVTKSPSRHKVRLSIPIPARITVPSLLILGMSSTRHVVRFEKDLICDDFKMDVAAANEASSFEAVVDA